MKKIKKIFFIFIIIFLVIGLIWYLMQNWGGELNDNMYIIFSSILIGWFGTYYMVEHYYNDFHCISIKGYHIHHLYVGILIVIIFSIIYSFIPMYRYLFFFGFGIGMIIDDLFSHFLFKDQKFSIKNF